MDRHRLEFLLAFDGHVHYLDGGYRLKFEIRRVRETRARPHGLSYALTLHAPDGTRLIGFDNAHGLPRRTPAAAGASRTIIGIAEQANREDLTTSRMQRMKANVRIQSLRSLREEMEAVRARQAARTAGRRDGHFQLVEALVRLLTPENRRLLALIRDRKPDSVAELVKLTGRAQPNLTRTLAKLEAAGFITMTTSGRKKAPSLLIHKVTVEIDPCAEDDRLRVA